MSDVNMMFFTGNICQADARCGTSQTGKTYVNFNVAITESAKKDGKWVKNRTYINCVWFGEYASKVCKGMTKGTPVTVIGKFSASEYQGKPQYRCMCENVILGVHSDFANKQTQEQEQKQEQDGFVTSDQIPVPENEPEFTFDSSDIPF